MTKLKKISIFSLILLFALGFMNYSKANDAKIYISNGNVYYDCPDGPIAAPAELNIDIESVKILNDTFFADKNNVYEAWLDGISRSCDFDVVNDMDPNTFEILNDYYEKDKTNVFFNAYHNGGPFEDKIKDADTETFVALGGGYAKDKNNVYHTSNGTIQIITTANPNTFEVLKEDGGAYAIDGKNMYFFGKIMDNKGTPTTNNNLYNSVKGKIILKVESNGEAYYVSPNKQKMYFLSRPVVAFNVMREQGIGITNKDLEKIPVADNYCPSYSHSCDKLEQHDLNFAKEQQGKIFLQVEENGEAWYVNPNNFKRYFLGRPADAFNIMRNLGLGISNGNFESLVK